MTLLKRTLRNPPRLTPWSCQADNSFGHEHVRLCSQSALWRQSHSPYETSTIHNGSGSSPGVTMRDSGMTCALRRRNCSRIFKAVGRSEACHAPTPHGTCLHRFRLLDIYETLGKLTSARNQVLAAACPSILAIWHGPMLHSQGTKEKEKNYMPECNNITPYREIGSRPQHPTGPCRAEHGLVYTWAGGSRRISNITC